jgi:hypothetical protein
METARRLGGDQSAWHGDSSQPGGGTWFVLHAGIIVGPKERSGLNVKGEHSEILWSSAS